MSVGLNRRGDFATRRFVSELSNFFGFGRVLDLFRGPFLRGFGNWIVVDQGIGRGSRSFDLLGFSLRARFGFRLRESLLLKELSQ
jgi:hypothetical protein